MTNNWYNLIEDYLQGKLPDSRQKQLEAAMADDPALAQAVQEHRMEWEAKELLAEKLLRAQIREAFEKHQDDSGNWFSKYWKWVLGSIVLLVSVVLFFYRSQQSVAPTPEPLPSSPPTADTLKPMPPVAEIRPDSKPVTPQRPRTQPSRRAPDYQLLAMASYRTPEGLTQTRGQSEDDSLSLAQQAFARNDFKLAALLLSPLPAGSGQEGLMLRGHAHFLAGDYAAASTDFSDLLAGGIYIRDAQWFGLLAEMATPGASKKDLMQQLDIIRMDANHPWNKEAAALWEKLK